MNQSVAKTGLQVIDEDSFDENELADLRKARLKNDAKSKLITVISKETEIDLRKVQAKWPIKIIEQ